MQTRDNSRFGVPVKQAIDQATAEVARQAANQKLVSMILSAGGLGLVGGAGVGLSKLLTEDKPYTPDPSYQPVDLMVPKKKDPVKTAGMGSIAKAIADAIYPHLPKGGVLGDFFGDNSSAAYEVPSLLGLGVPLGAAAMYGGYRLGHGAVDKRRKAELDAQLENAQNSYTDVATKALSHKMASDADVEAELDALADLYEKTAEFPSPTDTAMHAKNIAEGPYIAYVLLSALGAGKLSYDYFKKRAPEKIQEEALRQRALERYGGTKPIQLSPVQV